MVFFTCNLCGDSLKKNKVEQHAWQCHTNSLSCVDCLKDFNMKSYSTHFECITEDQKYGGQNYKQKELKGKSKQMDWILKINSLIETNQFPHDVQNILKSLVNYDNIPRKKAKFINFVKNSFKIRNEALINRIWEIFENSVKNNNVPTQNSIPNDKKEFPENQESVLNNKAETKTEKNTDENVENQSPLKKSVDCDENISEEKIKMKKVVLNLVGMYEQINISKLRKKALKFYHKRGHFNDEDILTKFEKVIKKDKFSIDNNIISLTN